MNARSIRLTVSRQLRIVSNCNVKCLWFRSPCDVHCDFWSRHVRLFGLCTSKIENYKYDTRAAGIQQRIMCSCASCIYICEHADQIITHTVAWNYNTWRYSCLIHSQLETVNVLLLLWYYELLTKSCGVWDILIFTINVCLKPAVQTLCIVSCLPRDTFVAAIDNKQNCSLIEYI